jgi:hypothetical protein
MNGPHPSHVTRFSDASTFDEICVNCGAHDEVPGGWGMLVHPCPNAPQPAQDEHTVVEMPLSS